MPVWTVDFCSLLSECRNNPDKPNEAILVYGDVSGQVIAVLFSAVNIALFDRPAQPAGSKQGKTSSFFVIIPSFQTFPTDKLFRLFSTNNKCHLCVGVCGLRGYCTTQSSLCFFIWQGFSLFHRYLSYRRH